MRKVTIRMMGTNFLMPQSMWRRVYRSTSNPKKYIEVRKYRDYHYRVRGFYVDDGLHFVRDNLVRLPKSTVYELLEGYERVYG